MKKHLYLIFILICIVFNNAIYANPKDIWYSFENNASELVGFVDINKKIKIEPKFSRVFANKFDNIIAVSEYKNNKYESYYLTKGGKKVGINSMHIWDNGFDCESEGFIRFEDNITQKIGLFDRDGNVAIPPIYSGLSRVHNGMIFALQGALRRQDGEHYFLTGGLKTLIDTKNNIIIENFQYDQNINLYSLIVEEKHHSISPVRDYFNGKNGKIYSFINYEKEFKNWYGLLLRHKLSKTKLRNNLYQKVSYWSNGKGWENCNKEEIKSDMLNEIMSRLNKTKLKKTSYFISRDSLNMYINTGKDFEIYYNNCNEAIDAKYPVMTIVIDGINNKKHVQDHFEFLRTPNGYKLVDISIRSE